jgi:hypothetical protein
MKLQSKFAWERFATAIKTGRIPLFDVGRWMFDVRCSLVFLMIKPAVVLAGGWAEI